MKMEQVSINKRTSRNAKGGLILIKALCGMAVLCLVTAVAMPEYREMKQAERLSTMMVAADYYMQMVGIMHQSGELLTSRQIYRHLPKSITENLQVYKNVESASVEVETGQLTLMSSELAGSYSLTVTPQISGDNIVWSYGGSCVTSDVCRGLFSDS